MPEQHRTFFTQLPFLVVAARDDTERPWVTVLVGQPGFITSPEPQILTVDAQVAGGDALEHAVNEGARLGLLGIELHSRRRNRLNGFVSAKSGRGLNIRVDQSFGNCPQYIAQRELCPAKPDGRATLATRHRFLTPALQSWISAAETFFIASGYGKEHTDSRHGMDASHRGGKPGFVNIVNDSTLVFPDYTGNNFFNTIGNLVLDPQVGLLFVDFENGDLLQISGRAAIDWESDDIRNYPRAQRLLRVDIGQVIHLENALPLRWKRMQDAAPESS